MPDFSFQNCRNSLPFSLKKARQLSFYRWPVQAETHMDIAPLERTINLEITKRLWPLLSTYSTVVYIVFPERKQSSLSSHVTESEGVKSKAWKSWKYVHELLSLFTLWQISEELLGICLPSLQRARLTDRNVGVFYMRGAGPKAASEQKTRGQHGVKRGKNLDNPPNPISTHPPSADALDVTQCGLLRMWGM